MGVTAVALCFEFFLSPVSFVVGGCWLILMLCCWILFRKYSSIDVNETQREKRIITTANVTFMKTFSKVFFVVMSISSNLYLWFTCLYRYVMGIGFGILSGGVISDWLICVLALDIMLFSCAVAIWYVKTQRDSGGTFYLVLFLSTGFTFISEPRLVSDVLGGFLLITYAILSIGCIILHGVYIALHDGRKSESMPVKMNCREQLVGKIKWSPITMKTFSKILFGAMMTFSSVTIASTYLFEVWKAFSSLFFSSLLIL